MTNSGVEFLPVVAIGLNDDEVDALVRILRSVGGTPTSGRQHADAVLGKLEIVRPGCSSDEPYPGDHDDTTTGSIYFSEHPKEATP